MRYASAIVTALTLLVGGTASAQRQFRVGPTVSSISITLGGATHSYASYGGSMALITGDDGEIGLSLQRYDNLSSDACVRRLTFASLDSYYYPVGPGGIAPFASSEVGLARVTQSNAPLGCGGILGNTVDTTYQLGLAFGFGLRINAGKAAVGTLEGRFFEVPNSEIQGLEARANVAVALGALHTGKLLQGTIGPVVSVLIPAGGPMRARGPLAGVRFLRDTKGKSAVGLQIEYVPLKVTENCSSNCSPEGILFAPDYEASLFPQWGRFYGSIGLLLLGITSEGSDRGVAQGAHGGIGVDIFSGSLMVNLDSRLLWFQRNSGESVFAVQIGASLLPKLVHAGAR
ncbi:MAG TPA: hypothetical protein VFK78_10545 [Gemmatimonadales bacterium]|nr:hypothetical protein [Gemmatimonadales bacterium]